MDWEPLERALMEYRYRNEVGIPYGPMHLGDAVDVALMLDRHVIYMKRVIYGDMTGPMADALLSSLRAEVKAVIDQEGSAITNSDETAAERKAPYAFNMEEAISYFEDNFPAPVGHEVKFEEVTVSQQKDPLGNYQRPLIDKMPSHPLRFTADLLKEITPEEIQLFVESWSAVHNRETAWKLLPDAEYGFLPESTEWLSLAKAEIPKAVKDYVKLVETGETSKWCKCPWAVHPDHVHIPVDHCVACGSSRDDQCHVDGPLVLAEEAAKGWHHFKGRGIRRADTDPACPVHTKEGLILGLFEHIFKDSDEDSPV